jgi:4-aminobutyrate aminotransferase-like enzyme
VLDEIEERGLRQRSESLGARLLSDLRDLTLQDAGVAEVRAAGLFLAVEFVQPDMKPDPRRAALVVNEMRQRRVLISASGNYDNVLKIRPPLVFPELHAPRLLDALEGALAAIAPAQTWRA